MHKSFATALLFLIASPVQAQDDDDDTIVRKGDFRIEDARQFRRLICKDVFTGSQINRRYLLAADAANAFGVFTPWDVVGQLGAFAVWDPRLEPLSYYHRTGPVGAVFHELRTRNGGRDSTAPIGFVGLDCGTPAAYARKGQSITFFDSNPDLKSLVVDTDRWFTFIADAKERGATIEVRLGEVRKNLAVEKQRFAALFVEMYDTGFDPGDRLTLEAVKLYFDRVREDGIVALHISNKWLRLEPVVAAIARELGLVARVWNDDSEGFPGKTATSWVVLAQDKEHLGVLGRPMTEQCRMFGRRNPVLLELLNRNSPDAPARKAFAEIIDESKLDMDEFGRKHGSLAASVESSLRRLEMQSSTAPTLEDLALLVNGMMFHELRPHARVGVRRDGALAWSWPRPVLMAPRWMTPLIGPNDDE
jgi:hypothetical protein